MLDRLGHKMKLLFPARENVNLPNKPISILNRVNQNQQNSLSYGQTTLSPYGKTFLSLIPMQSRQKPDIKSTIQRELRVQHRVFPLTPLGGYSGEAAHKIASVRQALTGSQTWQRLADGYRSAHKERQWPLPKDRHCPQTFRALQCAREFSESLRNCLQSS